ncbi:MAG: RecB family exonuclease [Candidatus Pacearchaeota archaeon]
MPSYSHSKIKTYEQCPLKFKYKYIDRVTPEIDKTIEAHLGQAVHDTLEWIYSQNQPPSIDEAIQKYIEFWKEKWTENIRIVKEEKSPKDYFNKGIQFLTEYYPKHYPFDDGTLECEKKVKIEIGQDGKYKVYGFIDRLVYNYKTSEYEIHDYKTSSTFPSQEEMEQERQLALYSIGLKDEYGYEKEVKLIWHFLEHGKEIQVKKKNDQLEKLKQETLEKIREIETATYFPRNESILCYWCEFRNRCGEDKRKEQEEKNKKEKPNSDYVSIEDNSWFNAQGKEDQKRLF